MANKTTDNIEYLLAWADDIRKYNGRSVDPDRLDEIAREIGALRVALRDLVWLERTVAPDMSGKRRTWAYMRNGAELAQCLDRAWTLLGFDSGEK